MKKYIIAIAIAVFILPTASFAATPITIGWGSVVGQCEVRPDGVKDLDCNGPADEQNRRLQILEKTVNSLISENNSLKAQVQARGTTSANTGGNASLEARVSTLEATMSVMVNSVVKLLGQILIAISKR